MPHPCNIDARGKRVRLVMGLTLLVIGVVLCVSWAMTVGGAVAWGVTAACLLGAAFLGYEARTGWCALRAMGIKTRV